MSRHFRAVWPTHTSLHCRQEGTSIPPMQTFPKVPAVGSMAGHKNISCWLLYKQPILSLDTHQHNKPTKSSPSKSVLFKMFWRVAQFILWRTQLHCKDAPRCFTRRAFPRCLCSSYSYSSDSPLEVLTLTGWRVLVIRRLDLKLTKKQADKRCRDSDFPPSLFSVSFQF